MDRSTSSGALPREISTDHQTKALRQRPVQKRTKLYDARVRAGLSMLQVYTLTGITPSHLSYHERALHTPLVSTAIRLAKLFGMSVEELFSEAL